LAPARLMLMSGMTKAATSGSHTIKAGERVTRESKLSILSVS
jgi:hypothetical protein